MRGAFPLLLFVLGCILLAYCQGCANDHQVVAIEWAKYGYAINSDLEVTCTDTEPFAPVGEEQLKKYQNADLVCEWPCAYVGEDRWQIWAFFYERPFVWSVRHEVAACEGAS